MWSGDHPAAYSSNLMSIRVLGLLALAVLLAEGKSTGADQVATIWRESLDVTADPCEDMHQFACGNWLKNNPMPADRAYFDRYSKLADRIDKETKSLYHSNEFSGSSAISKLRLFYQSCLHTTINNPAQTAELLQLIGKIGKWPAVHGEVAFNRTLPFDLTAHVAQMTRIRAMDVFFASYGNVDLNNVTRTLIHFDRGSLGMAIPHFYLDPQRFGPQLSAYEHYMRTVLGLIVKDAGEPRTSEEISADVKEIVEFEKLMAYLSLESLHLNKNASSKAHKLSDMSRLMPMFDWKRYFLIIMPEQHRAYVESDPDVIIVNPRYFLSLNKLLQSTSPRLLANVMMWRFADAWWMQLDRRYHAVRQDYMRHVIGIAGQAPRWKECNAVTGMAMAYASDALYVAKHFNKTQLQPARQLFEELRSEFMHLVDQSEWMDQKTKQYAKVKAQDMAALIGAENMVYNFTELDEYYKDLDFDPNDSYGTMVRKHSLWKQRKAVDELLRPVDRYHLPMSATTVNAAYTFVKNALTVPSAILQKPFFDNSFPMAFNYGAIGSIISHEIVHGFDIQGRQFDRIGNRLNWWSAQAEQRFYNRSECMVRQYAAYQVPGTDMFVDGMSTQGENIADNGGIKQAFRAYKKRLARAGRPERRIPGFEQFDNEQMFFISYATSYCGQATPAEAVRQLYSDSHAPASVRINAVLSNQPEFAQAFKCSASSKLNSQQRCSVW